MSTITQNTQLLKELACLLIPYRSTFNQERTYQTAVQLVVAEMVAFARHTVTQLLLSIGCAQAPWNKWYRLFSKGRFKYDAVCEILFEQTLTHAPKDQPYVVAGDGTQTRRSSRKMEGAHWLHNPLSPVFKRGIHVAQRWFNCSWLLPCEKGYSRAVPIRWLPAFTEKSKPTSVKPRKEWEAARDSLMWVRQQLDKHGRSDQPVLMVADGAYDTLSLWKALPAGTLLVARSAKNRALWYLPTADAHPNRKYGDRAPVPAEFWQERGGWNSVDLLVRDRRRRLSVKVEGPFLRRGAANRVLFLIVVRGKDDRRRRIQRSPLPFLVNAVQDARGQWRLPLPVDELLAWTWQRWEIEVAHRELKSNFGLGNKQCWNPQAAVLSVQWSAWVYALLLLAGYRCWGLTHAPPVPTRWWRGSGRWSLNTLWRAYRAALWGGHTFTPLALRSLITEGDLRWIQPDLRNTAFAAARS